MEFVQLTKEEYILFTKDHEQANFLNSYQMHESKIKNGFNGAVVGVKESGKVIAAAALHYIRVKKFFHYAYAPRGFVMDYENKELLTFFTNEIKTFLKSQNIIYLVIDPYVRYCERDRVGNEVENGFNHKDYLDTLSSLGYKHQGFTTGFSDSQARWIYEIDLPFESEDELIKSYERNARRAVENAKKLGVSLRKLSSDEISVFADIMKETEMRKGFPGRDLAYYQEMYETFSSIDAISFRCSELDVRIAIQNSSDDIAILQKEIDEMRSKNENLSKKQLNKINEKENQLNKAKKTYERFVSLQKENGDTITLSAGMWFEYANEYLCLLSGVFEEYMDFGGPHFMHHEMMREILSRSDFHRYNFYGISGDFSDASIDKGVLAFKQSFGGYVSELLGDFHLVIDPVKYKLVQSIR